ncbi:MAG TPA: 4Fe-4S binding protein [Candidatus Coprovicinus avistercoris]|uniref:4Fe-4S binding protein n=1 Tax=Candidatus Coprovicinus avistercoris TaxID=2840754 RepID=A0A9D1L5C1_9ACTN|nr:4Fe-4S binding protein [Candidatus Coprovicinus avistercoris]
MADKRDMLDDFIDIQKDWKAVSNPLGNLVGALAQDPGEQEKAWDPSKYKWKPRANSTNCLSCLSKDPTTCTRCIDVCPVNAIQIEGSNIRVSDACRKCGLCIAACPTDAFSDMHHSARQTYDAIAKAAASHERCYVTCTRALGRPPEENEILLPCVGCVPTEVWFSILVDYPNVSVYLPYGICDKCRTTTGELALSEHIAEGEELAGRGVGLEMEEANLNHAKKRSYERREFMSSLVRSGQVAVSAANPVLAGAQVVAKRIQDHSRQITELQNSLEKICGANTTQKRKRTIVQKRQLILSALQAHPALAERFSPTAPSFDPMRCTMCGECVHVCPTHAIDLDATGHVRVESVYCVGCGACAHVCPEQALHMEPIDPETLVVPDESAEKAKHNLEKQKEEVARLKEVGKQRLMEGLELVEGLATGGASGVHRAHASSTRKKGAAKKGDTSTKTSQKTAKRSSKTGTKAKKKASVRPARKSTQNEK